MHDSFLADLKRYMILYENAAELRLFRDAEPAAFGNIPCYEEAVIKLKDVTTFIVSDKDGRYVHVLFYDPKCQRLKLPFWEVLT